MISLSLPKEKNSMSFPIKLKYTQLVRFLSTVNFILGKDDYAYTKITTITPQYVIVNGTSKRILIQQIGTVNDDYSIPINGRIPFHWKNSDSD